MRTGQKPFRAGSTLQARRRRGAGTYTWRQTPPSQTGMDLVSENSRVQGWGTFVQAAGTEEGGRCSPGAHSRVPSSCSHCGPGFAPWLPGLGPCPGCLATAGAALGWGPGSLQAAFPLGSPESWPDRPKGCVSGVGTSVHLLSSWSQKSEGGRALSPPHHLLSLRSNCPQSPLLSGQWVAWRLTACQPPCPCTWRSGCRDRAPVQAYRDRHLKARPWWPQQARGSGSKLTKLTVSAFEPWAAVTAVGTLTGHAGASVLTGVF